MAARFRHSCGDRSQLIVQTPYGRGLVMKERNNEPSNKESTIKEIRLLEWESPSRSVSPYYKKVPMLYTVIEYPTVPVKKGDDVLTPFGRGVVTEIVLVRIRKTKEHNKDDNVLPYTTEDLHFKYRVLLTSWRLAGRSRVQCYLFSSQVKVLRPKTLYEMDAIERIEHALREKDVAGNYFKDKNYNGALNKYAEAVDTVRYIQHNLDSSNESRADLLVVIVTCSNNAATCCIQLEKYDEASRFAKNALILLNALYNKRGMKIHGILLRDHGLTDSKIFGEWRGKSCLIIAKSEAQKECFDEAFGTLQEAKDFVSAFMTSDNDTSNGTSEQKRLKELMKEILKVKSSVTMKKKALLEKEKEKAKKMFSGMSRRESKSPMPPSETQADKTLKTSFKTEGSTNEAEGNIEKLKDPKRVTFAANLEERRFLESERDEDVDLPWYQEHKEALILLSLAGLAFASTIFSVRKRQ